MQYQFNSVAEEILEEIRNSEKGYEGYSHDQWGTGRPYEQFGHDENGKEITVKPKGWNRYSKETIQEFQIAYLKCREAGVYAQRVDWFLSGDDGEESFHQRLEEDIRRLYVEIKELEANNWYIGVERPDDE